MRIFIALDIPGEIRARMTEYMERARGYAPGARWARAEGLHVTLKFIGHVGDDKVAEMKTALAAVKAAPFEVRFEDVGFFPSPNSPRVFWIGVHSSDALPQLAAAIDQAVAELGVTREEKPYRPHLTLARAGSAQGANQELKQLQIFLQKEAAAQFGTMTAREFWMYQSQPQKGGSKYTKLQRFALE
ncbi:MAG: RNA 2',3'-cyclic phosphodiesterase [Acidobacteriia bacterium]|nr:RNA 2',3'-cyclic phosphodiesterase [Terriglobia bacterium]